MIGPGIGRLPPWAADLLPRLNVQVDRWADSQNRGGFISPLVSGDRLRLCALFDGERPTDYWYVFAIGSSHNRYLPRARLGSGRGPRPRARFSINGHSRQGTF